MVSKLLDLRKQIENAKENVDKLSNDCQDMENTTRLLMTDDGTEGSNEIKEKKKKIRNMKAKIRKENIKIATLQMDIEKYEAEEAQKEVEKLEKENASKREIENAKKVALKEKEEAMSAQIEVVKVVYEKEQSEAEEAQKEVEKLEKENASKREIENAKKVALKEKEEAISAQKEIVNEEMKLFNLYMSHSNLKRERDRVKHMNKNMKKDFVKSIFDSIKAEGKLEHVFDENILDLKMRKSIVEMCAYNSKRPVTLLKSDRGYHFELEELHQTLNLQTENGEMYTIVKTVKGFVVKINGVDIDLKQEGDIMKIHGYTLEFGSCICTPDDHESPLYIPLQFFFCQHPGLALPLIALQYHEVKINFKLKKDKIKCAKLWTDYIYLDTEERRKIAQESHEMLITQVQHLSSTNKKVPLYFNHPCKELVWTCNSPLGNTKLTLNGHDRMAERDSKYFSHVQPYQHHTSIPRESENIHVYSFCLKPEEAQPSGSCNFSRIDNAELVTSKTNNTEEIKVWATNINILRIMSGMGGLAYSN